MVYPTRAQIVARNGGISATIAVIIQHGLPHPIRRMAQQTAEIQRVNALQRNLEDMVSLEEEIKWHLTHYNMSITEAARQMDLHPVVLIGVINGQITLDRDMAERLAWAFHKPAEHWLKVNQDYEQALSDVFHMDWRDD